MASEPFDELPDAITTPASANEIEPSATAEAVGHTLQVRLTRVRFKRFKQFRSMLIEVEPGLSLVAGANNAGKSTLLHGLAVWEFCRTATLMERGEPGLLADSTLRQGFGLGDDEFSPINVPSLKHLWTNLKTAKTPEDDDGYTLQITCEWTTAGETKWLGFALSLANDRLFIKTFSSNLEAGDLTPACAYLPPFAGIRAREERVGGAIRRRRIGEGLAGAILRNLLLDMDQENSRKRAVLKGDKRKIADPDLRRLREEDPWELLQQTLRQVFGVELQVDNFAEEYHSYINVEIVKGIVDGFKLTRHQNYNPRDLMVEGSGFLQWLSVYALAVTPGVNVLMFDEPDAHLHPSLQQQLVHRLQELALLTDKQVLIATHSSEILRSAPPEQILSINDGKVKYLTHERQKVGMLAGIGSSYAPKMDHIKEDRRILFVEGSSDLAILRALAKTLDVPWPDRWVEWKTSAPHKDRKSLFIELCEEFGPLEAMSLRDRDDEPLATVGERLSDKSVSENAPHPFRARKWRRRYIESYLVWPPAIAAVTHLDEDVVRQRLQDDHGIAIGSTFVNVDAPDSLLDLRAKAILKDFKAAPIDVAKAMPAEAICVDVQEFIADLAKYAVDGYDT